MIIVPIPIQATILHFVEICFGLMSKENKSLYNLKTRRLKWNKNAISLYLSTSKTFEFYVIKLLVLWANIKSLRMQKIGAGPTVDNDDIKKLLPWLDWAYHKSLSDLDIQL